MYLLVPPAVTTYTLFFFVRRALRETARLQMKALTMRRSNYVDFHRSVLFVQEAGARRQTQPRVL